MCFPVNIKSDNDADHTKNKVPENNPSPADYFVYNQLVRLINKVDIEVKIVVYDISGRSDQNRRNKQQNKIKALNVWNRAGNRHNRMNNAIDK